MKKDFIEILNRFISWNHSNIKIIFGIFIFVAISFILTGCNEAANEDFVQQADPFQEENEGIKVGNDGVNAGIASDNDDVSIVSSGKSTSDDMVSLSIEDSGRADPFLPEYERQVVVVNKLPKSVKNSAPATPITYDLLPPPEMIVPDSAAKDVMETKVSGIMYDDRNPSAILRIKKNDYLVKVGDDINGYKVLGIDKNYVTVQYGANVYKASVGELLTGKGVKYNTVSNLENKFGGNKSSY